MTATGPATDRGRPTARGAAAEALHGSFRLLRGLLLAGLVAYLFSGVYLVPQHQTAIELRLGRAVGARGPGLHLAWPRPLSEVVRVDVGRQQAVETRAFWYAATEQERLSGEAGAPPSTLRPGADGYLLTRDGGIVHGQWRLTYQVTDPVRYVFSAAEPRALLAELLEQAAASAVARRLVDAVLAEEQDAVRRDIARQVRETAQRLELGIRIDGVVPVRPPAPPRQVQAAFDDAARAGQVRAERVARARTAAQERLAAAETQAAKEVAQAQADAERDRAELQALAQVVAELAPEYRRNPDAVAHRLWREAVTNALAQARERVIVPRTTELRVTVPKPEPDAQPEPAEAAP